MATIEERAKAASEGYDDDGYSAGLYMGYVVGATAQKAIDIEKAKTAFSKSCGWLSTYPSCESWYNELFENFIKNMEGQL